MQKHNTQPYQWGEIALSQVVYIDGIPHITKQAIGEWLEYSEPRKSINKILERNSHIDHYSTDVKLTSVDSKNRDTKVYHPVGFLLIVMESGQPKAIEMKVAVAEFVWQFAGKRDVPMKDRNTYIKEIERLCESLATTRDAMLKKQRIQSLQYFCQLASWPMPDLELLGKDAEQLALGYDS
jgi:prophage antirepressor-like protein